MTALAQAEDGLTVALRLVDDVRECGVVVTPAQSSLFVQALAAAPDASLRHIARAALARTPDDLAIVDDVLGRVRHLGDRAPEIRRVAETFADGGDAHASDRRRTSASTPLSRRPGGGTTPPSARIAHRNASCSRIGAS